MNRGKALDRPGHGFNTNCLLFLTFTQGVFPPVLSNQFSR